MTGFFRRWHVLRVRNFRNLFLGQAISAFGDGLTPVAITFAVLQMTGSATDLGIVLAAQITPLATLALVAGVWGDRLRREWVMLVSDGVRACSQGAVAFLLLTHSARIWELVVLLAVYGAAQAFFVPAAGALTPQLVEKSDVQAANAVLGFAYGVGLMVGPAVAGALIAVIGPGGAVAIDAATFVVSAGFLATLRVPSFERLRRGTSFLAELRDGWREVRKRPWLGAMLLRTALLLFIVSAPFQVLGPLVLNRHPDGATRWGIVLGAFSGGILIGGAIALFLRFRRPVVACALLGAAAAASPLVLALGGQFVALAVVQSLRGVAVGVHSVVWTTTLQLEIPNESLARVSAWDWMCSLALWPLGLALAGPATAVVGLTAACWLSAGLGLAASLWVLAVRDVWRLRTRYDSGTPGDGTAAQVPVSSHP